jgi:hypothetical protein
MQSKEKLLALESRFGLCLHMLVVSAVYGRLLLLLLLTTTNLNGVLLFLLASRITAARGWHNGQLFHLCHQIHIQSNCNIRPDDDAHC